MRTVCPLMPLLLTALLLSACVDNLSNQLHVWDLAGRNSRIKILTYNGIPANDAGVAEVFTGTLVLEGSALDAAPVLHIDAYLNDAFVKKATGTANWRVILTIPQGTNILTLKMVNEPGAYPLNTEASLTVNFYCKQSGELNFARNFCDSLVINNQLYVIGGSDTNYPLVEKWNVNAEKWEVLPLYTYPWKYCKAATDGRYIYIHGGVLSERATSKMLRIDPVDYTCLEMEPSGYPKTLYGFIYYNRQLIAVGGYKTASLEDDTSILVYDIALNQWHKAADLPVAMGSFCYVRADNLLYMFAPDSSQLPTDGIYTLNLDNFELCGLNAKVPALYSLAAAVIDGRTIYLTGGNLVAAGTGLADDTFYNTQRTIFTFSLADEQWRQSFNMETDRMQHTAAVMNSAIYIAGGISRLPRNKLKSVEVMKIAGQ